jgi:hypothetical protein
MMLTSLIILKCFQHLARIHIQYKIWWNWLRWWIYIKISSKSTIQQISFKKYPTTIGFSCGSTTCCCSTSHSDKKSIIRTIANIIIWCMRIHCKEIVIFQSPQFINNNDDGETLANIIKDLWKEESHFYTDMRIITENNNVQSYTTSFFVSSAAAAAEKQPNPITTTNTVQIRLIQYQPMSKILDLAMSTSSNNITSNVIINLHPIVDMLLVCGDWLEGIPPTTLKTPQIYFKSSWPIDLPFFLSCLEAFGGSEQRMGV